MDFELYETFNGLADRHETLAALFRFFAQDGQLLFLALLAGLFFARGKWRSLNGRHGVAAATGRAGLRFPGIRPRAAAG